MFTQLEMQVSSLHLNFSHLHTYLILLIPSPKYIKSPVILILPKLLKQLCNLSSCLHSCLTSLLSGRQLARQVRRWKHSLVWANIFTSLYSYQVYSESVLALHLALWYVNSMIKNTMCLIHNFIPTHLSTVPWTLDLKKRLVKWMNVFNNCTEIRLMQSFICVLLKNGCFWFKKFLMEVECQKSKSLPDMICRYGFTKGKTEWWWWGRGVGGGLGSSSIPLLVVLMML